MDSSLPQSLKHIVSNAEYYGPSIYLPGELANEPVTTSQRALKVHVCVKKACAVSVLFYCVEEAVQCMDKSRRVHACGWFMCPFMVKKYSGT